MRPHHTRWLHLGLIWLVLLLIPLGLLLTQHALFPLLDLGSPLAQALYWLTSTGTAPYGLVTSLLLVGLCARSLTPRRWFELCIGVLISQCICLGINHSLKSYFKEPRPNVVLLANLALIMPDASSNAEDNGAVNSSAANNNAAANVNRKPLPAQISDSVKINITTFYHLDKAARSATMAHALAQLKSSQAQLNLAPRIEQHWIHESGYAFPSGHSLFAATLVLVVSYYLLGAGQMLLASLLSVWGILMGLSRMLLGMHWPQDVLFSGILAAIIAGVTLLAMEKWQSSTASIANPNKRA